MKLDFEEILKRENELKENLGVDTITCTDLGLNFDDEWAAYLYWKKEREAELTPPSLSVHVSDEANLKEEVS